MRKCRLLVSVWLMMLFSLSAQAMALKSWEGDDTSLQQQVGKGKWAVVIFWRHDCEFCKREVPGLSAFHERNKDTQAEVIGVSIDGYGNKALAEEFVAENQPAFPSLIGEIQTVARSFQQLTEEGLRGHLRICFLIHRGSWSRFSPVCLILLQSKRLLLSVHD
ncbi:TlpA disulfide reductase family protein [Aliamphritea spongicola]|nr:TlpA disulfide reductase family protein [Aliamphritea spongicola]